MTTKRKRAPAGSGALSNKRRSDGLYAFRYYENGRQVTAPIAFKKKADALLWNAERLARQASGDWHDPSVGTELLRVFGERELALKTYTPRSRATAEWLWTKFVDPAFGDWQLSKINLDAVESWRAGLLANGLGAPTVRLAYNQLKMIMAAAEDKDRIRKNPCRIKGASSPAKRKRHYVSYDQSMAIIGKLPVHLRALATTAWWSAGRRGELLGLQWRDINFETGELHICRQIVEVDGQLIETEPKWHSDRFVSVGEVGLDVLRAHREGAGKQFAQARVFTNRAGDPLSPHALGQAWVRARAKVGLQHVTFHDLRRSSATAMLASGMSIYDVMAVLGHENITTTQRYLLDDPGRRPERAIELQAYVQRTSGKTVGGTALA